MITKQNYLRFKAVITKTQTRLNLFKIIYKFLPIVIFVSYPLLLGILAATRDGRLLRCITVPLGVFVTVTLVRKFLNFRRPYEALEFEPVFPKSTKGKSFPSRHTASAAVIAITFLYVNTAFGIVLLVFSILIAFSRVLAGVHYPRDVIAGFLFSVVSAAVLLFLL